MLSLTDVTLTFPDGESRVTAVDRATLDVKKGQVFGVTGPSGSGKSSLLAVASTLIKPDSGSVDIDGTDATRLSLAESASLRREKIGIIFQQANLLPSMTAIDQVRVMNELGAHGARSRRREVERRAKELLDLVGLSAAMNRRPAQLSGGQRQRVNIARALVNDPSVLIVDEPTSALDQERGHEIIELITKLTRELDTATLLVTHDQTFLPTFDGVAVMTDGVLDVRRDARASDAPAAPAARAVSGARAA